MNWLTDLSTSRIVAAIGWTLLHSLWIGTVMLIVLKVLLLIGRRASAATRYAVCCASMLSMMLLLAVVFRWELHDAPAPQLDAPSGMAAPAALVTVGHFTTPTATSPLSVPQMLSRSIDVNAVLNWIVLAWAVGTVAMTARLLGGGARMHGIRTGATCAADELQSLVRNLAERLHLEKTVRVMCSTAIDVPCVIGWLKPIVLLPPAIVSGLSISQLEAVLAHEMAHIARNDYLLNILQSVGETLLFYHPAVWWIARQIRIERENCCDDMAVAVCGSRIVYAQALEAIELSRLPSARLAVAANGAELLPRIRRLAVQKTSNNAQSRWPAAVLIIGMVALAQVVTSYAAQNPPTKTIAPSPRKDRAAAGNSAELPSVRGSGNLTAVEWDPDGPVLIQGGSSSIIAIAWDPDGSLVLTERGDPLRTIRLLKDGTTIVPKDPPRARPPVTRPAPVVGPTGFEDIYKLEPSEIAKFIPAPFLEDRWTFIHGASGPATHKGQAMFYWTQAGELRQWGFGGGAGNVAAALSWCGLEHWEFEGDKAVLWAKVDGDWIFRETATREEKLVATIGILSQCVPGFQLRPQMVERDVITVQGAFDRDAHPDLCLSGPQRRGNNGGGSGTLDDFVKRIGAVLYARTINEADDRSRPPFDRFSWTEDLSIALADHNGKPLVSPAELKASIEKETGLKLVPGRMREPVYVATISKNGEQLH